MKLKTYSREKDVVEHIKRELIKHKIDYIKVHGNSYQKGVADLLIFNKNICYGVEVKLDMSKNKPSQLQIGRAKEASRNLIVVFVDKHNYIEVLEGIIKNDIEWLKHLSKKQISFWNAKYESLI